MPKFFNSVRCYFDQAQFLQDFSPLLNADNTYVLTTEGCIKRGFVDSVLGEMKCKDSPLSTSIVPNPTVQNCLDVMADWGDAAPEWIVAIGGGSVIDGAKAAAAIYGLKDGVAEVMAGLSANSLSFGEDFSPPKLIAVPTTAGTGSEVTMWGTIWDPVKNKKYSVSDPKLYPYASLYRPDLTVSQPEDTTIFTALDSLSHALESIWNVHNNPVSDEMAVSAIRMVLNHLVDLVKAPTDLEMRRKIQVGSALAGVAFSQTRTALAHSISYPLTLRFGVPHGLACSFTLAEVLRVNGNADESRTAVVLRALESGSIDDAITKLYQFYADLGLGARLSKFVGDAEMLSGLDDELVNPARAANNLVNVSCEEAGSILRKAYATIV